MITRYCICASTCSRIRKVYIYVSDTTVFDQQSHPPQVFVSRAGGCTSAFGSDPTFRGYWNMPRIVGSWKLDFFVFLRSKTKTAIASSPRIGYVTPSNNNASAKTTSQTGKRTTRLSEMEDLSNQTACCVFVFSNTSQISVCAQPCCISVSWTATNFIRMGLVVTV